MLSNLKRSLQIGKFASVLVVLIFLPQLTGCENQYTPQPELVEVHGQVLLDGQPVPDTKVVFVPDGDYIGSKWFPAYGTTNENGEFQLKLRNEKNGAYSGWHRVFVSHVENDQQVDVPEIAALPNSGLTFANVSGELFPSFYNRESELRFEVKKDRGILRPKFELSSVDPLLTERE